MATRIVHFVQFVDHQETRTLLDYGSSVAACNIVVTKDNSVGWRVDNSIAVARQFLHVVGAVWPGSVPCEDCAAYCAELSATNDL